MLQPGKMKEIIEEISKARVDVVAVRKNRYGEEEVERDLQVLGVRRWKVLVIDRDKRRGIVQLAKDQSRL